ncbi:MAG: right-handed parallel beta-helix repeat-containing protein [Haliangium ochraceum]
MNDTRCGATPAAGSFCPTVGGATFSQCSADGQGCFFVSAENTACTAPQICDKTTVVATGTACGCPAAAPAGAKLVNTACPTVDARTASATDDAVLVCTRVPPGAVAPAGCLVWQVAVNCANQQLTAGQDPVTNTPACVCKTPARWAADYAAATPAQQATMQKPNQYFVDPDPTMSTFMTGQPTGAQFLAACRERTLTTALGHAGVTEVVALHESSSNVHFKTGAACATANSCEVFPLTVGANVRMYTGDVGSFNPAHYTIDVNVTNGTGNGVVLAAGARMEGYTVDASATGTANAGTNVVNVVASPTAGAANGLLNQVAVLANGSQVGVLVNGQSTWSLTYVTINGAGIGLRVDRTDSTGTSSVAANDLAILSAPGASIGLLVGPNSNSLVTLMPGVSTQNSIRGGATGVAVSAGTVTLNSLNISDFTPSAANNRGYNVTGGTVNINGGGVVGGSVAGFGIDTNGGTTTVTSSVLRGGNGWTGVRILNNTAAIAGTVTLTGTAAAKTIIENVATTTPVVGVQVGSGAEALASTTLARLTVSGNTTIQGNTDGLVVNNGHVIVNGPGTAIQNNTRDGVQVLSNVNIAGTMPMDPLSQVNINGGADLAAKGVTISTNGRLGLLVRDVAPFTINNATISGNGPATGTVGGGVDIQRSQATSQTGYLAKLTNNAITANKGCGLALTGGDSHIGGVAGPVVCGVGVAAPAGLGGKVSADIENNTISGSVGVGLYISEAPDAADGNDITEVIVQSNVISGNLSTASGTEPIAGGVYIAASNADDSATPSATQIGCTANDSANCTYVRVEKFLGNTVRCNGRHEIGFGVPQRTAGARAGNAWDISSAAMSVDMATACSASALTNTITGYGSTPGVDLGVAVTDGDIHVTALGVHWQNGVPSAGVDYSAALGVAPTGNDDAASWVFCSATAATCQ